MKRSATRFYALLGALCWLMAACLSACAQPAAQPNAKTNAFTDKGWPRTFTNGATSFAVYQPQIEKWQDNKFAARAAVAVTSGQSKQPAYGVVWFTARTEVDKVNRLVTLTDFNITKVSFPANTESATHYHGILQARALKTDEVIALDRLLAEMSITQARTASAGYQLNNQPPQILFSTSKAILVLVDGEPVWRPVKDTHLQRIINTRVLIVRDADKGKCYLHLLDGWLEADSVTGPWSVAASTPSDLKKALAVAAQTAQVDLLDGAGDQRPTLSEAMQRNALPVIYVSLKPAELLQTQGEPQLAPIAGTQLVYVTNTENDIFLETVAQDRYMLIAGRWFRGKSMNGPWEYVPGERLPADFARISPSHEKASVLASVPGTPQALEALIANEVPQTATISRNAASLTVSYDGQPQFRPIESTTLQYAVNTATPVIAVSADSYYAVLNGVWFVASAATGPWTVAASVPTVIYTIPPSSPVHNVTYVKVYGATAETVYVGYTPGYYGTVVSSNNVVVYGTGWRYAPYVGSYYYGWGCTYGYGAGFTWNTYAGWGVAFGIGYGWSSYYYPGAWTAAAYYPAAWGGVVAANVYGHWGNVAYAGTRAAWANPYTGNVGHGGAFSGVNTATGTRYNGRGFTNTNVYTGTTVSGAGGVAYNPYTGRSAVGQAGAVSNAYTGNAAAGARGAGYNPRTGVVSGGAAGATYDASTGQVSAAGRGFAYNTRTDTGVAVGKNNVYAGHDGEVYRYNKSDGLQQHTDNGWSGVNKPADAQRIQDHQAARATGQQRWDSFRTAGGLNGNSGVVGPRLGSGGGFGGGGGLRGGGRLRR
ncbi:MAG: carbohydrate-binding family V/XII [Acidobacteria bacterium]|nr:carbohydrate-binding family V/XII [Acidobacteriota bacterium]MBI3425165.1 carbohydrate-binding family V/XII [Acidobacteriota bacterium]